MSQALRISLGIVAVILFWAVGNAFYIVPEGQQALVVRLGKPMGTAGEPGLKLKVPGIDSIIPYESRLLLQEPPIEQVILGDQKRLEVQTYTRFRISDPLKFYQSVRTVEQARAQLSQIISSSLRRELGQVMLRALLSPERVGIVANIQKEVAEKTLPLGIEVVEVRIHRADLPYETSQAIYDRMKSEREREAKELRAQGSEWAQQIQAKADSDRTVILSEAQRQSTIARGEADAQANRLLADAFGKDPAFYRLYRSLQTYRQALANSAPTLVLSPDAAFLHDFKSGPAQ